MCGLFGYIGKQNQAAEIVFKGIKELEYRGYDSWGEAILGKKKPSKLKIIKKIGKIKGKAPSIESNLALGHTRWATHGKVTISNSHPQLDCYGRFALVHNGIIENFDSLKDRLIKAEHIFKSDTDTEVAAHLIEENLSKGKDFWDAFGKSFLKLAGLNALVVLDTKTKKIYAAKKGSPLVVGLGKKENFISSDISALLPHTRRVAFLEDNQGVVLSKNKVVFFDLLTNCKIKPKSLTIPWAIVKEDQGKFEHFMLKEIYEQPKIISNIIKNSSAEVKKMVKVIKSAFGTFLIGCGTAAHAALFGQYLFSKVAHHHVNFAYGSEFGFLVDFLTDKSFVLALSQSGETIDIIESVDQAKKKGAKIGALVNVLGSTLYRKADYRLLLLAGQEKAVAATKSFTAKLAFLIMIASALANRLEDSKKQLVETVSEINRLLKKAVLIKKIAKDIAQHEDLYFIGRGLSYPLAIEAALKVKEVAYIHAEGFAAGELKHGVIALIKKGTPCFVFARNDDAYGAVISGAMELKARGGYIIGITHEKRPDIFDDHILIKDTGTSTAISQAVVVQLLAYFLAKERGCEIDKPRNLAKSVTVK